MKFDKATIERFWANVKILGANDCWEWQLSRNEQGYGRFSYGGDGNSMKAHRYALMATGEMPEGDKQFGLHSCDNPPCCNPAHLSWGNKSQNMLEAFERNPAAKACTDRKRLLLPSQVDYMRKLLEAGFSVKECAEWYCIAPGAVYKIRDGLTYKDSPLAA